MSYSQHGQASQRIPKYESIDYDTVALTLRMLATHRKQELRLMHTIADYQRARNVNVNPKKVMSRLRAEGRIAVRHEVIKGVLQETVWIRPLSK